uniref:Uncharacterized protein n=1 Tax=Triticum urartu TaxID=4572 RepID=A0A8R7V2W8_TRIUA
TIDWSKQRQQYFLIIIQDLDSNNSHTFTWTVNYSGYSTTHEHESEREREAVTRESVAVGPAVRDCARGDPSPALLHEPLQRRLPRHGQVAVPWRGACCGSYPEHLGRPLCRDLVQHQHLPAVEDGHLRMLRRRTHSVLVLQRGHFRSGHEGESHRPRLRRLDAAAENAARCSEPSALSAPCCRHSSRSLARSIDRSPCALSKPNELGRSQGGGEALLDR